MGWPNHYAGDVSIKRPWDVAKVAEVLGVTKKDVYRLASTGELNARQLGARKRSKLFFDPDEVLRYDRGKSASVGATDA